LRPEATRAYRRHHTDEEVRVLDSARKYGRSFSRAAVAVVVTASAIVAIGPRALADGLSCGSVVSADTTLTQDVVCPADWNEDALRVTAAGVTLDLAGFDITGPGAAGVRILAENVAVINTGSAASVVSGFDAGVVLDQATGGTVRGLTLQGNDRGIQLAGGSQHLIATNVVSGNVGDGINAGASSGNTIRGNTIAKNGAGIALDASVSNTLEGNTVSKNRNFGIAAFCGADANTISANSVVNTSGGEAHGIIVRSGSDDTVIVGNGVNLNAGDGIHVDTAGGCSDPSQDVAPTGTEITGNSANRNGGDGVDAAAESTIAQNTANRNGGWGFLAPTSCDGGGNTAQGNTAGPRSFATC
jgi:parallel beta-helix repeat protein